MSLGFPTLTTASTERTSTSLNRVPVSPAFTDAVSYRHELYRWCSHPWAVLCRLLSCACKRRMLFCSLSNQRHRLTCSTPDRKGRHGLIVRCQGSRWGAEAAQGVRPDVHDALRRHYGRGKLGRGHAGHRSGAYCRSPDGTPENPDFHASWDEVSRRPVTWVQ